MACAATRTWDVCRHESWAPAHHRVTMHHRRLTPAARHHGHDHVSDGMGKEVEVEVEEG